MGKRSGIGLLGVLLFFVLSGFLITGLLQRELSECGRISLSLFYQRRVLRLFPALLFYIAVVSALIAGRFVTDTPWYAVAACILYVRNIWGRGSAVGHIWSLSLEEQFYMIWPPILRWLGVRRAFYGAIAGTLAVSGFRMMSIRYHLFAGGFAGAYQYRPWFRFDSILIGCSLALWLGQPEADDSWRNRVSSGFIPLLCWPALAICTLTGDSVSSVWKLTAQTLLSACILLHLIVTGKSFSNWLFRLSWLRWFGRISYSWYLWQQLFTQYSQPGWGGLRRFPLNAGVSLILAVVSYHFIEQPFLRLRDRIGRRGETMRIIPDRSAFTPTGA